MSKNKYRPSVADFEVVQTEVERRYIDPSSGGGGVTTGGTGGEGSEPMMPEWPTDSIDMNWYPSNLRVVSQEVRYNEQGRMRVDVTLEWDELDEADAYFVRISEVYSGG